MTTAERTVLDLLREKFPDSSTTTLRKMLQDGRVRINGAIEKNAKRVVHAEDAVDLGDRKRQPDDSRVRILFEDADVIVVDKSVGLLSVPGEQRGRSDSVETILNARAGAKPGEQRVLHVHRLDFDTSGVLVFAKNSWTRERLAALFEKHDVERVYVAIVHGTLDPPSGTIRSWLAEDRDLKVRSVAAGEGKEAVTHYATIAIGRRFSRVELRLATGRRNQIRVHMSEAGHPVAGDAMYGNGKRDGLPRLALHARSLSFVHPRSGTKIEFSSEVPREMQDFPL